MGGLTVDKVNNICLMILAGTAAASVLVFTKSILIPFILSIFCYFIVSPLIEWTQTKLKLHKSISAVLVLIVFSTVSALIVLMIVSSLENFFASAADYKEKIIAFGSGFQGKLAQYNIPVSEAAILEKVQKIPLLKILQNITGGALNILSNSILILIFTLFLIAGETTSKTSNELIREIKKSISFYISTKLALSVVTGVLSLIVYWLFKLDLSLMFGLLTNLLNYIPSIGSIFAVLLPIPVILLQFGFGWEIVTILCVCGIIQFSIGNVLEPKMMGESMDLHPVTILLMLTFWGFIWGIPGMFMSVPITAILKISMAKIEVTKPVAELFAGRFS